MRCVFGNRIMRQAIRQRNLSLSLLLTAEAGGGVGMAHAPQPLGRAHMRSLVPFRGKSRPGAMGNEMKLAVSRELHAYWDALRGARLAPERNDVEPGAIRGILADTFILEFDAAKGFPLRIAGSRTNALFLREMRGRPFVDCWRAEDRAEIAALLIGVADEAQPALLGAKARPRDWAAAELEVLLLPLRYNGATHARLLGCIAPHALPAWLGLAPVLGLELVSMRALERRPRFEAADGRDIFGAAPAISRRGHLFVHGDAASTR